MFFVFTTLTMIDEGVTCQWWRRGVTMNDLKSVSKPKDRPNLMTILGDSGVGKTTLACSFEQPTIVIRSEDGLQAIPKAKRPDAFPVLKEPSDLWAQLVTLLQEEHTYKTLVIDSVTSLERMFIESILAEDTKARGIQQALGGYGNGRDAVAAMHGRVRKAAGMLVEKKNMSVIFIAHADVVKLEPPDSDAYSKYSLRLHDKSMAYYVDDVDAVLFLRLQTYIKGKEDDPKKAVSDGTRIVVAHSTAANVSKNRFGINQPIVVPNGENPILDIIKNGVK
jgi:hypothetical protein